MCCWRRQHPRCQSKQDWSWGATGVLSAPLTAGRLQHRQPWAPSAHTKQPRALQDSLRLASSIHLESAAHKKEKKANEPLLWGVTLPMTHYNTEKKCEGPFSIKMFLYSHIMKGLEITGLHILNYLVPKSQAGSSFFFSYQHQKVLSLFLFVAGKQLSFFIMLKIQFYFSCVTWLYHPCLGSSVP